MTYGKYYYIIKVQKGKIGVNEMEGKNLVALSISQLKNLLKTADEKLAREIKAELNCRGIYLKKKGIR